MIMLLKLKGLKNVVVGTEMKPILFHLSAMLWIGCLADTSRNLESGFFARTFSLINWNLKIAMTCGECQVKKVSDEQN
ncbi:hypothetical protein Mapa_006639 [Marchantia paleacea]|nr:hypothetical protein Mapa_006639 [Marchantia paleacea]